jgi:hypothetical protein
MIDPRKLATILWKLTGLFPAVGNQTGSTFFQGNGFGSFIFPKGWWIT